MAILSSEVNAGDDILASQYNNLRIDLLTGDITIAGVKTFSSAPICSAGITLSDDSSIAATKKFYVGSASYMAETASNIWRFYTNNIDALIINSSQEIVMPYGCSPGFNEVMMWDVVLFSLDGTAPDSVAYTVDETKIRTITAVGHDGVTKATSIYDQAAIEYTESYIINNLLYLDYGTVYVASDTAEAIVFYVA